MEMEKEKKNMSDVICQLYIPLLTKCGALRDLVPFVQFKKREKHPWRSVTFSKVVGFSLHFTKINTPPWVFFTFFELYKGTKSRNASQIGFLSLIISKS